MREDDVPSWKTGTVQAAKNIDPLVASLIATNLPTVSARSFPVSEPEPLAPSQFNVELLRQIDAVCRRFEADRRAGRFSAIGDYLGEVPEEGHPALRAELLDSGNGLPVGAQPPCTQLKKNGYG